MPLSIKAPRPKRLNPKTVKKSKAKTTDPTEPKPKPQQLSATELYAQKWLKDPNDSEAAAAASRKSPEIVHKDPPSEWGTLGPLPQEALDMIYENLFAAGDVALTRVNKTYHANTRSALVRRGVYRVHIEPRQGWRTPKGKFVWGPLHWRTDVDSYFALEHLTEVRELSISIRSDVQSMYSRHRTTPEQLGRILAELERSVPSCRRLRIELQDVSVAAHLALDTKIGELEFLSSLDSLSVSWNDYHVGARSYALDLRGDVDGLENIETLRGFRELCREEDPRIKSLIPLPEKEVLEPENTEDGN